MGKAAHKHAMHEIDETRAAGRDEAFEELISKIVSRGGEITKDEISPLYLEVGNQEFEVGSQRIVEINVNKMDFQLIRKVETHILQGSGHQKHIEELSAPRSHISMKRKSESSTDWLVVDMEELS